MTKHVQLGHYYSYRPRLKPVKAKQKRKPDYWHCLEVACWVTIIITCITLFSMMVGVVIYI